MVYNVNSHLYVKSAGRKGLGVFTTSDIPAGCVVENCPLVELNGGLNAVELVGLGNRYFERDGRLYVSLGYGGLYNHSWSPNLDWEQADHGLIFTTMRRLHRGDELTIRYADSVPFEVA